MPSTPDRNFLSKEKLEASIRVNVIVLSMFAVLFALMKLIDFMEDVFAIFGGALMVTYLLLGAVNVVENWFRQMLSRRSAEKPEEETKQSPWQQFFAHIPFFNPRVLAVLVIYVGFLMAIALASLRILPTMSVQVRGFALDLPSYLAQLDEKLMVLSDNPGAQMFFKGAGLPDPEKVAPSLVLHSTETPGAETPKFQHPHQHHHHPRWRDRAHGQHGFSNNNGTGTITQNAMNQMMTILQRNAPKTLHNLLEFLTTTVEGMLYLIATLVIIFYLLLDGKKLKTGLVEILPESMREKSAHFLENTHTILYTFIKGQVVLGFLAGMYMYFFYWLFDVKYAGFLSAFYGISSILPVVGPWVGLLPGVLVVLFSHSRLDLVTILMVSGSFYVLKEYWITRKLVGNVLEIHPVVVILAFLFCVKLGGILGAFLAFPLASLVCVTIQYFQGHESVFVNPSPPRIS